jgi:hypothetical protein
MKDHDHVICQRGLRSTGEVRRDVCSIVNGEEAFARLIAKTEAQRNRPA